MSSQVKSSQNIRTKSHDNASEAYLGGPLGGPCCCRSLLYPLSPVQYIEAHRELSLSTATPLSPIILKIQKYLKQHISVSNSTSLDNKIHHLKKFLYDWQIIGPSSVSRYYLSLSFLTTSRVASQKESPIDTYYKFHYYLG